MGHISGGTRRGRTGIPQPSSRCPGDHLLRTRMAALWQEEGKLMHVGEGERGALGLEGSLGAKLEAKKVQMGH